MASGNEWVRGGLGEGEEGFLNSRTAVKCQIVFHTFYVGHVVVLCSRKHFQICCSISKCLETLTFFFCANEWSLPSTFLIPINCHLNNCFIWCCITCSCKGINKSIFWFGSIVIVIVATCLWTEQCGKVCFYNLLPSSVCCCAVFMNWHAAVACYIKKEFVKVKALDWKCVNLVVCISDMYICWCFMLCNQT